MSPNPSKIFVSYRRSDTGHATRLLATTLRQAFGPEAVFVDTESIQLGEWPTQIERALLAADLTLVVIGTQWLNTRNRRRIGETSDWVWKEIDRSITREIKIVPLLIDAKLPAAKALPDSLSRLPLNQAHPLRYNSWDSDVDGLIKRLEGYGYKRVREKHLAAPKRRLPRIILMDSYAKIYDRQSASIGMNSHVIRGLLQGMNAEPIAIEPVHPEWQGSDAVARWKPDLLIIHYSCLDEPGRPLNLLRFLRYMLLMSKNTKVIVYSRNARPDEAKRRTELERAIDSLANKYKGRVFGLPIYRYRNRVQKFSDPETAAALLTLVKRVLARRA